MEIIKATEGLTKKQIYKLTHDPATKKVQNAVGQHDLKNFALYTDIKNDGAEVQILAMEVDDGEIIATNSQTFIPQFEEAYEMLEDDGGINSFEVLETSTKSGRKCYQFRLID